MSLQKIKITYPQHIIFTMLILYLIVKILYTFYNTIHEYKLFYLEESLSNYCYLISNIIQIFKIKNHSGFG